MAAVEDINGYFSSISNLANKVASDVELIREICMQNGEWAELTFEEKEQMIDRYMIEQAVVDKYANRKIPGDIPECFPVLKIPCGEKIVVDFEHDEGWTWTDEHSAPFSWKTRSQQDLTFADIDEVLNPKEDPAKKNRFAKRPRSPDRSVWETPITNGEGKNEIEQMFEKFGIKIESEDEQETTDSGKAATESLEDMEKIRSILNGSEIGISSAPTSRYENKSFVFDGDDLTDSLQASPSRGLLQKTDSVPQDGISRHSSSGKEKHPKKHRDKEKKPHRHGKEKRRHREKEITSPSASVRQSASPLSGDICFGTLRLDQVMASNLREAAEMEEFGDEENYNEGYETSLQISEVTEGISTISDDMPSVHDSCRALKLIIADQPPGESSTDDYLDHDDSGEVGHLELSTSELLPVTPPRADDSGVGSSTAKSSGFDFLDNW